MTSDPSFACGFERSLYNSLTETNLDCWNTSNGITSKISSCTFILWTGCVFKNHKGDHILFTGLLMFFCLLISLCNEIKMIIKTEEMLYVPGKKAKIIQHR